MRIRHSYLNRLAIFSQPRSIDDLGLDDILEFLARPGWAPETRKSARAAIRSYFKWATETGRIAEDPSRLLPAVRIPPSSPRPTPDAVFEAALAAADERDRLMVMLAAYAGLRRGEIARVNTDDIVEDVLRVCGKGGRVREIPLHPMLVNALAGKSGFLFPGRINGHLSADRVGVILRDLLGQGWTAHTLRHRFATRAYAVERDLLAVQTLLGHSKPETTRRYTLVPNASLRVAVMGAA